MPKDEEDQVTSADQQKINQFSRLNARSHEIEEDMEWQKKSVDELNDLSDELCLLDDDEPVKFKFGDSFFEVTKEKAEALLEELVEEKKEALAKSGAELSECRSVLQGLKTQLYAKFGSNINLEE